MVRETGWAALDLLTKAKKQKVRQPWAVIDTASQLLKTSERRLGDDAWGVREQLLLALLDANEVSQAETLLKEFDQQFPDSQRVARLHGLVLECQGKYSEATKVYDDMLETNPGNTLAQKRKACILKAQGKVSAAIKHMNDFVHVFQSDPEAWQELGALYLQLSQYRAASYCFEELMLLDPRNHLAPLAFAEVAFTADDSSLENTTVARKYCAHSLVLNPERNVRALWGLLASTERVTALSKVGRGRKGSSHSHHSSGGVDDDDGEVNSRLDAFAREKLLAEYNAKAPADIAKLVAKVLEAK